MPGKAVQQDVESADTENNSNEVVVFLNKRHCHGWLHQQINFC